MRYIRVTSQRGSKPPNPFMQALGFVVGVILFIGAALIGGLVLAALVGFVLIAGLIIYARIWWLTRKARRQQEDAFVEAEYRVIEPSDDDEPRR